MITTSTVTAGNDFDFTTAFANPGDWNKIKCNTIAFYTSGAITSWSLYLLDPSGDTATLIYTSTTASFYTDELGPLPVDGDGRTYQLRFETSGMDSDGILTIDHQSVLTRAT